MVFYAGQRVTAGQANRELEVDIFRAGQKVRPSVLGEDFPAQFPVRAPDLNALTGVGPGPGPGGVPANPGEALWIGHGAGSNFFNVGIGQGNAGVDNDTNHVDYSMEDIANGLEVPNRFQLVESNGVWYTEFRINAGAGRTSTGTDHPRSELRELTSAGDLIAWDGRTGYHMMRGISRIADVTQQRPWVCFFQIHDASSDLVRVQCEGSAGQTTGLDLRVRWQPPGGSNQSATLPGWDNAYDVGDEVSWEISVGGETSADDGRLRIWINGELVFDEDDMGTTGCYFKTGCYLQSNVHIRGEDPDDTAAVWLRGGSLVVQHPGYPPPSTPVWTG